MLYCLLTNDVETHSIWFNELRDETGYLVYKNAMPNILDLYRKYNVRATFFYTGYIAKLIPDIVKMIIEDGHEIGCHGLVHKVDQAFDVLNLDEQIKHLKEAKKILEDISGKEVISFRAPALRINKFTPIALYESGFKIDSSISPQRLDMFLSFGSWNKFERLLSPRKPYITKNNDLAKKGDGKIIEIPLSSFIFPLVGSTMRVFPKINKLLTYFLLFESKYKNIPISTYLHPNEFIDESNQIVTDINNRSKNFFEYILADLLRRKLKIKNLGPKAFVLYENQIQLFNKVQCKFVTMKEFCQIKGLLR